MIRQVLPPSVEQIEAARRVMPITSFPADDHASLRGRPVFVKMESFSTDRLLQGARRAGAVDASRRDDPNGALSLRRPVITDWHRLRLFGYSAFRHRRSPQNASVAKVKKSATT